MKTRSSLVVRHLDGGVAAPHPVDLQPVAAEVVPDQVREPLVVLHEQHAASGVEGQGVGHVHDPT